MESAVTVFPQPLSPTRQNVSPDLIANDTPSTARKARSSIRKSTERFSTRSKLGDDSDICTEVTQHNLRNIRFLRHTIILSGKVKYVPHSRTAPRIRKGL